ncbi:histidine phosphatase family protein [Bacillus sp. BGMRC 2118]|nr:histidine phosphatase family protein [Bacillus sp. BGMRC 2118]
MNTFIYLVRHGDSPKTGDEGSRGLTQTGEEHATQVAERLRKEGIHAILSSPYTRSLLTVEKLANELNQEVLVYEELKERMYSVESNRISDKELLPLLEKSFSNPKFSLIGAESNEDCQKRAIHVLQKILQAFRGRRVVIGTHGIIMTLMLSFFDKNYDLNFLLHTSKPDIYRMEFNQDTLVEAKRMWKEGTK